MWNAFPFLLILISAKWSNSFDEFFQNEYIHNIRKYAVIIHFKH
jgi:hypothetical protein